MNGSEDDIQCEICGKVNNYSPPGTWIERKWYCLLCYEKVTGKVRIAELEAENVRLRNLLREERPGLLCRILCWMGFHKWSYHERPEGRRRRACSGCGRKQHLTYDMAYGETYWGEGWL